MVPRKHRRWQGSVVWLLCCVVSVACSERAADTGSAPGASPGSARSPAASAERPRNAIILLLDTLRADRLGCYGHERNTSPVLDSLAERGVCFEQAFSPAPWTLPATGSLLSGMPPERCFDEASKLSRSLISSFSAAGWSTAAFTEAAFVSSYFGMDRGFDQFVEAGAMRTVIEGETVAGGQEGAGIVTTMAAAKRWLELQATGEQTEPFVLLVHSYEVHMPYNRKRWSKQLPSGRFGERLEMSDLRKMQKGALVPTAEELAYVAALYDGGVRFADKQVGELLAALDELGLADDTLIVVTSDHGEELGAHHPSFLADHGHSLKDDLLNVPLLIMDPTTSWPVSRVPWQVRLMDVLPTVAGLLGVPLPDDVVGRSLVPLMAHDSAGSHRPLFAGHTKAGPPRRALRDGSHKLIVRREGATPLGTEPSPPLPSRQLYDLLLDPGELQNVESSHGEDVERLERLLAAWEQQFSEGAGTLRPEALDDEVMRQLQALGYVR